MPLQPLPELPLPLPAVPLLEAPDAASPSSGRSLLLACATAINGGVVLYVHKEAAPAKGGVRTPHRLMRAVGGHRTSVKATDVPWGTRAAGGMGGTGTGANLHTHTSHAPKHTAAHPTSCMHE